MFLKQKTSGSTKVVLRNMPIGRWAIVTILCLGKGTLLAKFDVESMNRIVPVHPIDHLQLGMRWKGTTYVYVEGVLPFGLCSASKLFMVVVDALLWIMRRHGMCNAMHCLDYFLLLAPLRGRISGSVGDKPAALSEPRGMGGRSEDRGTQYDH